MDSSLIKIILIIKIIIYKLILKLITKILKNLNLKLEKKDLETYVYL